MITRLYKPFSIITFSSLALIGCGGSSTPAAEENKAPLITPMEDIRVFEASKGSVTVSAFDPDGSIASYLWEQTSGPELVLEGTDSERLIIDSPETLESIPLTFKVTVTDNDGASASRVVNVNIAPERSSFPIERAGLWASEDASLHILFGEKGMTQYISENGCVVDVTNYQITDLSSTQIQLTDSDEMVHTIDIELTDEKISFTLPDSEPSLLTQSFEDGFDVFKACDSTKTIKVELSMRALPQQLKVNRGHNEYEVYTTIVFDVNNSGKGDVGDMSITISAIPQIYKPNQIIDMGELTAHVWFHKLNDDGELNVYTHPTLEGKLSIRDRDENGDDETFSLSFTDTSHSLIRLITTDTPMFVISNVNYTDPETETYGTNTRSNDGPWFWQSNRHTDYFPNSGTTTVNSGVIQTDNLNDQKGQAALADIDSVQVILF